jgi:hypothetical protein
MLVKRRRVMGPHWPSCSLHCWHCCVHTGWRGWLAGYGYPGDAQCQSCVLCCREISMAGAVWSMPQELSQATQAYVPCDWHGSQRDARLY